MLLPAIIISSAEMHSFNNTNVLSSVTPSTLLQLAAPFARAFSHFSHSRDTSFFHCFVLVIPIPINIKVTQPSFHHLSFLSTTISFNGKHQQAQSATNTIFVGSSNIISHSTTARKSSFQGYNQYELW